MSRKRGADGVRALCDIKVSQRFLSPISYHHVQLQNKTLTKAGDFRQRRVPQTLKPSICTLSLGLARIQGLFVYARLISQSRGSIPYRAWCWSLESVRSKGAGASLTLGYCGEQQQRGQEAYNIWCS